MFSNLASTCEMKSHLQWGIHHPIYLVFGLDEALVVLINTGDSLIMVQCISSDDQG